MHGSDSRNRARGSANAAGAHPLAGRDRRGRLGVRREPHLPARPGALLADALRLAGAGAVINAFAHFRATVGGLGIHFIHQRGTGPAPRPLIITHGWPGSFIELLKIVPLLRDPARYGGDARDAFDVVIPSLPGYGFSDRPSERGMHPFRIADLWVELMEGLGYQRFGAQGG